MLDGFPKGILNLLHSDSTTLLFVKIFYNSYYNLLRDSSHLRTCLAYGKWKDYSPLLRSMN